MNGKIFLIVFYLALPALAGDEIPEEVTALLGTYTGTWTGYRLGESGEVVKSAAWTDVMTLSDPVVEGSRVYANALDEMTFEEEFIPPMKVSGAEGYFINEDGSLGDYFFETSGQVYRMQRLATDVWAYATPVTPAEFEMLGLPPGSGGQHVLIKVVTHEGGIETHRITRVTTVRWTDSDGVDHWTQFTSLQGYHRKQD
jgi:hypothetical protein